jgi:diadenosine tetraphosphatase ApaH/serine/threonine PP2A family protein phosphatase
MRVAVISDVHANEHALTSVLDAIDAAAPREIWCLGDTVGYGPAPNRCCALVAERAAVALIGNHDLVVLDRLDTSEFNNEAAAAAQWARERLDDDARAWLESLDPSAKRDDVALFHASARDPVWEYVLSGETALASLEVTEEPLVLVGHSHVALAIGVVGRSLAGGLAPAGTTVDLASGRWLLNPGSVGQPRDGDPRAAWIELDLNARSARFHRVEYDVGRTQAEIRDAGLPEPLAARLAEGL